MFTYKQIRDFGIVTDRISNLDLIVHPLHDKIISLRHINNFLFGINEIPSTTCESFLLFKNIIIKINKNNNYLIL